VSWNRSVSCAGHSHTGSVLISSGNGYPNDVGSARGRAVVAAGHRGAFTVSCGLWRQRERGERERRKRYGGHWWHSAFIVATSVNIASSVVSPRSVSSVSASSDVWPPACQHAAGHLGAGRGQLAHQRK
jgi:hypothetical protein